MSAVQPQYSRKKKTTPTLTSAADTFLTVPKDEKRLTVRISSDLKRKVHAWAVNHDTSINQIIVDCLESFIHEQEK